MRHLEQSSSRKNLCADMRTEPSVGSTAVVEKLSTLEESESEHLADLHDSETEVSDKGSQQELNNNINNNNRKLILDTKKSTSFDSKETALKGIGNINKTQSAPTTPQTPPTTPQTDGWIGLGTHRRRKLSRERARSLKTENEELGLENVIPYHRSPKALSEMGEFFCYFSFNYRLKSRLQNNKRQHQKNYNFDF